MFEPPNRFYKYASAKTAEIVLANRMLRWSTPGMLNDPYDVQFDLQVEVQPDAVRSGALDRVWAAVQGDEDFPIGNPLGTLIRYARRLLRGLGRQRLEAELGGAMDEGIQAFLDGWPKMVVELRNRLARSKILCFSDRPDIQLLWAHYAEQHYGVVLEFGSVDGADSPYQLARPMNYVAELPVLLDTNFLASMLSGQTTLNPTEIINHMLFTKSNEWAYEREWRLYSGDGRTADARYEDVHFAAEELKGLIFGIRTQPEVRERLSIIVADRYPHARLMQARQRLIGFGVDIDP